MYHHFQLSKLAKGIWKKIEIKKNRVLRIKNEEFLFRTSKFELTEAQKKIMKIFGFALLDNLIWEDRIKFLDNIVIEGHTDSRNFQLNPEGNWTLSKNRALETWKFLTEYPGKQFVFKNMKNTSGDPLFQIVGRAATNPISKESSTAEMIRVDRRVDFVFNIRGK